jgi:hypothetical protein
MAGQAASEIRVGANGTIYVAPSGTTPPVDITSPWTGFVNMGYATEDGGKIARSMDTEMVKAWQSISVLRYIITGVGLTCAFELMQSDKDIIPLYFGGGSITTQAAGKYRYDISSSPTIDERVFGLEWTDGALVYRFIMGRAMVTETGETTVGRSAAIQWPMTMSAMTPNTGTVLGYILTNDSAFA